MLREWLFTGLAGIPADIYDACYSLAITGGIVSLVLFVVVLVWRAIDRIRNGDTAFNSRAVRKAVRNG